MIPRSTYRQIDINQNFQKFSYNINLNQMSQIDQSTSNKLQSRGRTQIKSTGQGDDIKFQTLNKGNNLNGIDTVKNDNFWTRKRKIILIFLLIFLSVLTSVTAVLCVTIFNKKKYKSSAKARQIILVNGQVIEIKSLKSTNNDCQLILTKVIKKKEERLLQAEEQPEVLVHEIWNEEEVVVTVGKQQIIHALNWSQEQLQSEMDQLGSKTQETVQSIQYSTYKYNEKTNKYELQEDNQVNKSLRRVLYEKKPTKWKVEDALKNSHSILKQKQKYLVKSEDYEGTLGPDDRKESAKQFQQNCFPKSIDEIVCKNKKENEQKNGTKKPRSWQIAYKSN